jgi:hypothetical protein
MSRVIRRTSMSARSILRTMAHAAFRSLQRAVQCAYLPDLAVPTLPHP